MINVFAVVGLINFIAAIPLSIYTFVNAKRKLHIIWGLFSLSVSWWGFGMFKVATTIDISQSIFWWRITEIGVILIPAFLTHFVSEFLQETKKIIVYILYGITILFIFADIFTDYFVKEVQFLFDQFYYITATPLYSLFIIMFLGTAIYNIIKLYKELKRKRLINERQIKYLILAFFVGFMGGATSFFPVYNINIYPAFNITILASALIVVYLIFKHQLLGIKTIATQFLIFSVWIFLIARILLTQQWKEMIIDGILLVLMVFFGYLIIRSVLKEVRMREEMEELAKELEKANVRLKELDKEKSDFVTIASHQLRTPVTAIKGYASMLLEGSYGAVSEKAKVIIDRVFQSSNRLVLLISDMLNLSRIERGKMDYDFQKVDLREMLKGLIDEFKVILAKDKKKQGIKISSNIEEKDDFFATADSDKIRQVIYNLIDNAIKYTEEGFVKVSLFRDFKKGNFVFKIADSGIGMSKESLAKIFEKFSRAQNGSSAYTEGTGLGLYVAREIAKAHSGNVWAESEGEGKGSVFYLELPNGPH